LLFGLLFGLSLLFGLLFGLSCCPTKSGGLVTHLSGFIISDYFDFIMSSTESFGVRFTGKNYAAWEFQFKLFVMGKELWGHIDGSDPAPTETKDLAKWMVNDARVMTWILGSVDPLIVLNLRPYKSAKTM
jgi:hypothetical protein